MSSVKDSIKRQAAAEQAGVQSWRQQQHRDIDRQAEELRIQQRKTASEEEEQVQRNIAQTDKAIETARKRRTIGIDTDRSALKEAKKEATEKQQKLQAAAKEDKKELTTAEAEARAEIETLAKESEADIEAQKDVALKDVELFEEDNVELNTGEWIDRDAYEALDSEERKLLMRLGISEYNNRKDAEFKQNNIQLKDGNWIDRTFYNELPSEQQSILLNQGIAGFENWQQQQIQASNEESWNSLQDLITATGIGSSITFEQWQGMTAEQQQNTYDTFLKKYTITVGNNEIVSSSWYESLSPEFQSIVATSGATGLESYIAKNYVTTDNEELIDKEYYNDLTTEQKDYIKRYGSQKFENKYYVKLSSTNELVDKNEYNKLPDELKNMLQVKGIDETQKYIDKRQADFNNKYIMLDNGDYVERSSFNAMGPTEQALLKKLGTSRYNAQKDKEFLNELPEDAQKHAKSIGISKFKDILKSTENMNDASAFATLQQIGVIPKEAEIVSRDKDGSFEYKMPVDGYTINLNNIDFDKLSDSDIKNILYTVTNHSDYKATREELLRTITPFSGSSQSGALSRQQKIALDKWLKELTEKQRKQVKTAVGRYNNSRLVDIISFIFPPAQALKPEITLADIKGTQWAEGFANIALLFVAPAIGAIGKAGSAAAKAASIASKGIQAAGMSTYSVVLAKEWNNLSDKERAISVALNIGIVGALYGKPLLKGLKSIAGKTGAALGKTPAIIEELAKAAKAKDVNGIKAAAQKLEEAGSKIKGANGRIVVEQSHSLYRQAENLVNLPKGSNVLKEIQKLNKSIAKHPESYMGGTGSPFNKKVNDAAEKIIEQTKRFDEEIRRNVIKPEGAKTLGSSAMTEQQRRLARQDIWQLEPKAGKTMAQVAEDAAKKPPPKVGVLERGTEKIKLTPEEYAKSQKVLARILKQAKPIKRSPRLNLKIEKAKAASASKAASQAKLSKAIQSSIKTIQTAKAKAIKQVKITESMQGVIKQVKAIDAQYAKISEAIKKVLQEIKSAEITEIAAKRAKQLTGDATPAEIAASKARLSSASIADALTQAQNMTANKAIQMLMRQNMITAAIANDVGTFTKIFEKADSKTQAQVYKQVSPAIASQLKTLTDKKTFESLKGSESLKDKVKTNTGNQAKIEIKALTSTLTEAEVATQEMIKNLTENTTQFVTENIAEVAPANITKAEVENLVDSYVETITQPEINEIVEPKKADIVKAVTAKIIKPIKPAEKTDKIKPFRPILIKDENGKLVEITEEQLKAAVGWKQGWAYWYIYPPAYGKGGKCRIIRKTPIKGIPLFKDAKSAYLSLTKIGKGKLPETIKIPMGITDLIIRTAKGGKPKSQYKRKATSSIPRLRTIK